MVDWKKHELEIKYKFNENDPKVDKDKRIALKLLAQAKYEYEKSSELPAVIRLLNKHGQELYTIYCWNSHSYNSVNLWEETNDTTKFCMYTLGVVAIGLFLFKMLPSNIRIFKHGLYM